MNMLMNIIMLSIVLFVLPTLSTFTRRTHTIIVAQLSITEYKPITDKTKLGRKIEKYLNILYNYLKLN